VKQVAEQATEIDDAFDAADTNGDGLLDSSEISVLLSALGEKATDEAVRTLTDAIAGEDGTIGRPEFKQWMVTNSVRTAAHLRMLHGLAVASATHFPAALPALPALPCLPASMAHSVALCFALLLGGGAIERPQLLAALSAALED
jgi:hypothetical protein